ncbi:MAG: VCBS repeat-containing protein [Myxococcota bacterium]|nr:VCBS repeat-containing protein [Myxococcota bacterium]
MQHSYIVAVFGVCRLITLTSLCLLGSCSSSTDGAAESASSESRLTYTLVAGAACAEGAPPPGVFTEVSQEIGIDFSYDDRPPWELNPGETVQRDFSGVGVGDLDEDGALDLYFSNSGQPDVYYTTGGRGPLQFQRNIRTGDTTSSTVVALADITGDGHLDAVLHEFSSYFVAGDGKGGFGEPTLLPNYQQVPEAEYEVYGFAIGDVSGDGWLDIYSAVHLQWASDTWWPGREWLFIGGPSGLVDETSALPQQEVEDRTFLTSLVDLDNDGDLDLFEVNDAWSLYQQGLGDSKELQGNRLLRNDGMRDDGSLVLTDITKASNTGLDVSAMGVAIGDYDNDGLEDLYVTAMLPHTNTLLRNQGDMQFEDSTYDANAFTLEYQHDVAWGAQFVDVDSDGWLDLFVLHGWHTTDDFALGVPTNLDNQPNVLLRNTAGIFEPDDGSALLSGDAQSRSPVLGDLNRDGFVDIVVGNADGAPYVYLNGCDDRPWLTVRLELSSGHNRFGIGERIRVKGGGLTQVRVIRSGGDGLYGNSAAEAYFGFPSGTATVDVEVAGKWIRDIPVRRLLTITGGM